MPGYAELLVGYAPNDPMREYADFYGGRCVSCGCRVFFNSSAQPVLAGDDHDPTIVCRLCNERHKDQLERAMI